MSSLTSQLLNSQLPTKNAFPYLEGSSNISVFMKALHIHLSSNFGIIGQNILNGAKNTSWTTENVSTSWPSTPLQ